MTKLASDIHTWNINITDEPPPPEILWVLVVGTITVAALATGIIMLKRSVTSSPD